MTNVSNTAWQPNPPVPTEYANGSASDIEDPSGNLLVDPSNNQIVDTGLTDAVIPSTVWVESPGN